MLDIITFLLYWIGRTFTLIASVEVVPGVPLYSLILVSTVIILLVNFVTVKEANNDNWFN